MKLSELEHFGGEGAGKQHFASLLLGFPEGWGRDFCLFDLALWPVEGR